jgi:hypothetical protein
MSETNTDKEKPSQATAGFDELRRETVKLFNLLGRAMSVTVQGITHRQLVHLDHEIRHHLDLLVESGAAQDRHEAVVFLINEGIEANRPLLKKIERANAQITSLQMQLHALDFKKA